MCDVACLEFGRANLHLAEVAGKKVLEVGSFEGNGSLRPDVMTFGPASYLGIDLHEGRGVDLVCDVYEIVDRFGPEAFDLIICTEVMEHVKYWQKVVSNMKQVLTPGGVILLTTRSKGFPYHESPFDFWRYELSDMQEIWADCLIEVLESDPVEPGVFIKVKKPLDFSEKDLSGYQLYSVLDEVSEEDVYRYTVHHYGDFYEALEWSRKLEKDVTSLQSDISHLQTTVSQLNDTITLLQGQKAELDRYTAHLEADIAGLNKELTQMRQSQAPETGQLGELKNQLAQLQSHIHNLESGRVFRATKLAERTLGLRKKDN